MRKMIIPLILFSLIAFGCVLNFDQNDTSSDAPRPLEPQVPVTPDVPGEGAEGDLHTESTPMEEGKFAESSNAFAFDIYNRVAEADQRPKRILLSLQHLHCFGHGVWRCQKGYRRADA